MKRINFTKLLTIFSLISFILSNECDELLEKPHDCEFYSKCLEEKFKCGSKGYPIGYGYKYCLRFLDKFDIFPEEGKLWVDNVLVCLKESLKTTYNDNNAVCNDIFNIAFDSHPRCYVDNGFCKLLITSPFRFPSALFRVYQLKDFARKKSIQQVLKTIRMCNKFMNEGGILYDPLKYVELLDEY